MRSFLPCLALLAFAYSTAVQRVDGAEELLVFEGAAGPGLGKHIVLVGGDEEYRSEETLPVLARILAERHGFRCTVLLAVDPADGTINPNVSNIPGLEQLAKADLCIVFLRFRDLPDEQMQYFADYVDAGKPIIGLRTATHAFRIAPEKKFAAYSWNTKGPWEGGFGRQVLGETWISHHGSHGKQATRGILVKEQAQHPILRGLADGDIFGTSDVYGVRTPLPGDSVPLVLGEVVDGLKFDDPPLPGAKNEPMMPIAWTKTYQSPTTGKSGRVFTTTLGAATDTAFEGTRRLIVNAAYWAVGLESAIPEKSDVSIVGTFEPSPFRVNGFKNGVRPRDLLPASKAR
ncbi:MAG: hypothetical protein C0483_08975 [Pirellula sp.]|nr:hypothetical protein [Pirellula sp.]